jgi:hypothetical protein
VKSIPLPTHACVAFVSADESIRPLRDVIIVEPKPPEFSKTIFVGWNGKAVQGVVRAVGPGKYPNLHDRGERDGKRYHEIRSSKNFIRTELKVGDVVHLGGLERDGYDFQSVNWGGIECLMATEADVAVVE